MQIENKKQLILENVMQLHVFSRDVEVPLSVGATTEVAVDILVRTSFFKSLDPWHIFFLRSRQVLKLRTCLHDRNKLQKRNITEVGPHESHFVCGRITKLRRNTRCSTNVDTTKVGFICICCARNGR